MVQITHYTSPNCTDHPQVNVHCIEIFSRSGFASNLRLRLPWNTKISLKIVTVLNKFFTFRIFEELALALQNRVCPEFTVLNIYFYHSEFLSNLRLPWKTATLKIFTVLKNIFIIQDFWATCACPENRVCPEILQDGGLPPYPPPRLVRVCIKLPDKQTPGTSDEIQIFFIGIKISHQIHSEHHLAQTIFVTKCSSTCPIFHYT